MRQTAHVPAAPQIRPIQTADPHALKTFTAELSPDTLYFRFGRLSVSIWSEEEWQALCAPHPDRRAHFVATEVIGPGLYAIVGMAGLILDGSPDSAEFGLVVADHRQHHGLGKQLMHAPVCEASQRGLNSVYGDVYGDVYGEFLPSNATMLSFREGLGFASGVCPDDERIHRMVLRIRTQRFSDQLVPASEKSPTRVRMQA